ncbi:MAG: tetratricopeptide repeat protein [Methylocystis sp.]
MCGFAQREGAVFAKYQAGLTGWEFGRGACRVKEIESIMIGPFEDIVSAAGAGRRKAVISLAICGLSFTILLTLFSAPAPALDGADQRMTSPTAQLPMFKDPRTALRAGLESYHAGAPGASIDALRYAADGGESLAQWKLGRMYADGDGVTRDDSKAFDYFSKIVEHFTDDDPDPGLRSTASAAFVAVGLYLREGIASAKLSPDPERAFDLFRYAATFFRNADAQYNVARMYLEGYGVKKDVRQGMNWLDLAARKGHVQAQAMLGELMFTGAGGAPQRSRGLMYLTLAREAANAPSEQWIVEMHDKALASASDADRKAAVSMLETYLKRHD